MLNRRWGLGNSGLLWGVAAVILGLAALVIPGASKTPRERMHAALMTIGGAALMLISIREDRLMKRLRDHREEIALVGRRKFFARYPGGLAQWALEGVRYYRPLGYFSPRSAATDEDLASMVARRAQEEVGDNPYRLPGPYLDSILLQADPALLYPPPDYEWDANAENQRHEEAIQEWARVSRGAFRPQNVKETWAGVNGPVTIEFDHDGARQLIHADLNEIGPDRKILREINRIIEPSGYQFWTFGTDCVEGLALALTQDEANRIKEERGQERLQKA